MSDITDRYIVRMDTDPPKEMGFEDNLDDAIAYAADAVAGGVDAEVWMMGTEDEPDREERLWPEADSGTPTVP